MLVTEARGLREDEGPGTRRRVREASWRGKGNVRRFFTGVLIGATTLVCLRADARIAVVSPADENGAPAPYTDELPEGAGGSLPLTWDYADELVPLLVAGAGVHEACEGDTAPAINVVVAQAMQLMTDLDLEGAVSVLDTLVEELPCLTQPPTSRELARIFYYRGATLAFLGESDESARSMQRALAIDPDLPPDDNLPREINTIFSEQQPRTVAERYMGYWLPTGMVVHVDGKEQPGSVPQGSMGLLQWQTPGSEWNTVLLEEMGDVTLVATPHGILERLSEVDPPVARLAALLGAEIARPFKVDGVLFWDGADTSLYWDASSNTTEWLGADGETAVTATTPGGGDHKRPKQPKPAPLTEHVRLALGGGVVYVHPFPYGLASFDANVRLYRGLGLGVGIDLGFPATGYRKPVVLPMAHLGVRYTFNAGKVHPWVGLSVRAALDDRPGQVWAMFGAGGLFGLDFPLTGLLMLRVSGEAGLMFLFREFETQGKISVVLRI